ncbi:hypothetical protein [Stenotrophomonas hibiscicola]
MTDFTLYPADDRNWFIRHIDGFVKPHLGTTSASVQCELAPIPAEWTEEPSELSPSKVAHLFGRRNPETIITTILVGAIPSVLIGLVFRQGAYVGSLPAVDLSLNSALQKAEASDLHGYDSESAASRAVHACTEVGRTKRGHPVVTLTEEQLYLSGGARLHSEFLVVRDDSDPNPGNHVEFVIPRVVIYRTYYGFSTKMANLFTQGQWSDVDSEAVFKGDFAGNKTGVNLETGAWHIVLALGMSEDDAHQTALLYFDDYAKAEANRLSNPMTLAMERVQVTGGADAHWYTNARLPLDPARGPYTGTVSGYFLAPRRDGSFRGKVFLVRAIHCLNFPQGLPPIGHILVNNNDPGLEKEVVDVPQTWPSKPKNKKRPGNMPNVDNHDASTRKPGFKLPSSNFVIIPRPESFPLIKDKSTTRSGQRKRNYEQPSPQGSSGNANGRGESQSAHEGELEKRAPYPLFAALIEAMAALKAEGHISNAAPIDPSTHEERVMVGGRECWNFLSEAQRLALETHDMGQSDEPYWPTRCWQYVVSGGSPYKALERAALVLRVDLPNGKTGIWFEIETREAESYTSALVIHETGDIRRAVKDGLDIICSAKGVSLSKHFRMKGKVCHCHPHYMEKQDDSLVKADDLQTVVPAEPPATLDEGQSHGVECLAKKTPKTAGATEETIASAKKAWSMGPLIAFFNGVTADVEGTSRP